MGRSIEPIRNVEPHMTDYGWTVPEGYKHPSCDGCGHTFYEMRPEPSKGGASVRAGFLCRWCQSELEQG